MLASVSFSEICSEIDSVGKQLSDPLKEEASVSPTDSDGRKREASYIQFEETRGMANAVHSVHQKISLASDFSNEPRERA